GGLGPTAALGGDHHVRAVLPQALDMGGVGGGVDDHGIEVGQRQHGVQGALVELGVVHQQDPLGGTGEHRPFDVHHFQILVEGHIVGDRRGGHQAYVGAQGGHGDRKSTRLNSSHVSISYAVFC